MSKPTYTEIATNYRLWQEYVDPGAVSTEAEFDAMSVEERVQFQIDAFGQEQEDEE